LLVCLVEFGFEKQEGVEDKKMLTRVFVVAVLFNEEA